MSNRIQQRIFRSNQRRFLWCWVVGVLFLMGQYLFGQTRTFYEHGHKIEHFQEKDGVPSYIFSLGIDKDGYLYLGNSSHFIKYDGYEFQPKKYSYEDYPLPSVIGTFQLSTDKNEELWLARPEGIFQYDKFKGAFNLFYQYPDGKIYTNLEKDTLNNFWIGSFEGLVQYNPNDSIIIHNHKEIDTSFFQILKEEGQLIAESNTKKNDEITRTTFNLKAVEELLVLSVGRTNESKKFIDFNWIETKEGAKIWEMDLEESIYAGGDNFYNRMNIDFVNIPSGNYKVGSTKDKSEPIDYNFLDNLPFSLPKENGISVYKVSASTKIKIQQFINAYHDQVKIPESLVFKDENEQIWVYGLHLSKIENKASKSEIISCCKMFETEKECPLEYISVLADKDEQHLWVGGVKVLENGLYQPYIGIFDKETTTFQEIKSGLPVSKDFSWTEAYAPLCLEQDKNGNLWIGNFEKGLYKLSPPFISISSEKKPNVEFFNLSFSKIRITYIYDLLIDRHDNLWVATDGKGLYKIDLKPSIYRSFNFDNPYQFMSLIQDESGMVWGAKSQSFIQLNPKTEEVQEYEEDFKGYTFENPTFVTPKLNLPNGNLLIGNKKEWLIYNPFLEKIEKKVRTPVKDDFYSTFGSFMLNDSLMFVPNQSIININDWSLFLELPTTNNNRGLRYGGKIKDSDFWLTVGKNKLVRFQINGNKIDTISTHICNWFPSDLNVDKFGDFWLATKEIVQTSRDGDGQIINVELSDSNRIYSRGTIEFDDLGNPWLFTKSGVHKYNKEKKVFQKIEKLKEIDGFRYSTKNDNGEFLIFGSKGLYIFHPDNLIVDSIAPRVNIEQLIYENGEDKVDVRLIESLNPLKLSHIENDINLHYIGISFNNSEEITYAYQLENYQSNWQKVGKDRTARFSNLPPGNYTFKVKAANADGIWSEPKSLKITILPPWWQTWWAYLVYALSFFGLLAYWYSTLQQKIKNKEAQLAKEQTFNQELQTLNLELKDINTANQRFVPNDFLQILGKKSIKDLQLGDQVATKMTVLFSDIRDYTPLSESMTPEENFKFINAYLGRVGPIIKAHGGFISSYLGDGFMALFVNEPENALKASIAAQKELENYNRERLAQGKKGLRTGMGLNTGELMLGVIGDEHRYESTVISDAVNTASRMEGLTKVFGAAIILSERTLLGLQGDFPSPRKLEKEERLVVDGDKKLRGSGKLPRNREMDFAYRYLGKVKVKGKDKAIKIYDLYEGETVAIRELKAQTKLVFEQGITHYFNRKFGKAAESFKQVLAANENDKAAQYYLDKSVDYIVNGVSEEWSGVEEMVMK